MLNLESFWSLPSCFLYLSINLIEAYIPFCLLALEAENYYLVLSKSVIDLVLLIWLWLDRLGFRNGVIFEGILPAYKSRLMSLCLLVDADRFLLDLEIIVYGLFTLSISSNYSYLLCF